MVCFEWARHSTGVRGWAYMSCESASGDALGSKAPTKSGRPTPPTKSVSPVKAYQGGGAL
jgi:hypothetical protein